MKTIALLVFFSATLPGLLFAQDSADNSPEKAAVMANDRAYEAAYAKADVKALADFFAEDAQYTSDDGQNFDGRAAIEKVREFYEAISQDQGVEIRCTGEGEVYAEPVLFRRALINLITNALRFTSSGGSVTVTLGHRNGESNVSVADTGCGISSQHIPHVFNRFFRGDASRNSLGTGLGLAIVKSIMQIHEGDVSVQSEVDRGTVVTLSFPDEKTNGAVTRQSNQE